MSKRQPVQSFDFVPLSGGYACRKQRAMIKTYNVIIATTPNTIRDFMRSPRLFGW
jgi:hypothetical protein